jgi:hypothetical protein
VFNFAIDSTSAVSVCRRDLVVASLRICDRVWHEREMSHEKRECQSQRIEFVLVTLGTRPLFIGTSLERLQSECNQNPRHRRRMLAEYFNRKSGASQ